MHNYSDMYELFEGEPRAKQYFDKLPNYVREQITTRVDGIHSFENLRDYAENLLRGDD